MVKIINSFLLYHHGTLGCGFKKFHALSLSLQRLLLGELTVELVAVDIDYITFAAIALESRLVENA